MISTNFKNCKRIQNGIRLSAHAGKTWQTVMQLDAVKRCTNNTASIAETGNGLSTLP